MFDNDSGNDDSTNNNQNNDSPARRFLYNVFGIGTDPDDEGEDDEEMAKLARQKRSPSVSNRGGEPAGVRRWSLGDHTTANDDVSGSIIAAMENLDGSIDRDLRAALEDAASMVDSTSVSGFECPVCGLKHGHSDTKHDIRSAFNVTPEFADSMPWVPCCHCGVNWLAEVIEFIGYKRTPMFSDEEQFTPFLAAGEPDDHKAAIDALREMEREPDRQPTLEDALDSAGLEVNDEMVDSFDRFYTRYTDIKTASNKAPIADETRNDINEMRERVVKGIEAMNDDGEDEDDRPVGVITFIIGTGEYGFLDVDGVDEDVFFTSDETEFINTTFGVLNNGDEVLVEVTDTPKGPKATSIEPTE